MNAAFNLALLAWAYNYANASPTDVQTAHHWVNWCAEGAFAACTTSADYGTVARCLEISIGLINK